MLKFEKLVQSFSFEFIINVNRLLNLFFISQIDLKILWTKYSYTFIKKKKMVGIKIPKLHIFRF